jgi:hypothetical protein
MVFDQPPRLVDVRVVALRSIPVFRWDVHDTDARTIGARECKRVVGRRKRRWQKVDGDENLAESALHRQFRRRVDHKNRTKCVNRDSRC